MKLKRTLCIFMCAAMVLCMTPIFAASGDTGTEDNWSYTENADGTVTVNGYTGDSSSGRLEIPDKLNGMTVSEIGGMAFRAASWTEVILPKDLTKIGDLAFYNCNRLRNISIPDTLTTVNNTAFKNCNNLTVYYGGNEEQWQLFANGNEALSGASIYYNAYPRRVSGDWVYFENGEGTATIVEYSGNTSLLNTFEIPDALDGMTVTEIGDSALKRYGRPVTILPKGLTKIGSEAFWNSLSLTTIYIPENVAFIGSNAFYACDALTNVYYGGSEDQWGAIEIESGNDKLTGARICYNSAPPTATSTPEPTASPTPTPESGSADGWTYIVNSDGTATIISYTKSPVPETLQIPGNLNGMTVTGIEGSFAYSSNNLKEVVLPNSIKYIKGFFNQCSSLTKINLPEGLTEIGENSFNYCSALSEIKLPESLEKIGDSAFYNTALTSVDIPRNVSEISSSAFGNCAVLTEINVSDENTAYASIGGVLYDKNISELVIYPIGKPDSEYTLPASVSVIEGNVLTRCTHLSNINVEAENQTFSSQSGVLFSKDGTKLMRYPSGKTGEEYRVPDGVTEIGDYAFYYNSSINSVTGTQSVKTIGSRSFYSCSALENITGFENVTDINDYAFYRTAIKNVDTFKSLANIGTAAFYRCESLKSISGLVNLENIGERAFYATGLTSLPEMPKLKTIAAQAFSSCDTMTSVILPASLTELGENAFYSTYIKELEIGCDLNLLKTTTMSLNTDIVRLRSGITEIPDNAFNMLVKIIVIPDTVTTIGVNAFYRVRNLKDVYYLGSEEQWNRIKFYGGNDNLLNSEIHYDSPADVTPPPPTPTPTASPSPTPRPTATPDPPTPPPTATPDPMEFKITRNRTEGIYVRVGSDYPKGTMDFKVITALYGEDDTLLDLAIDDASLEITKGGEYHIKTSKYMYPQNPDEYVKILLWDNLENCKPLCEPFLQKNVEAFPGAEGGGKYTPGGRGYNNTEVYHVTNLADSGPGSFRDAVSEPGRIVVFDVGGTINLENRIRNIKGVTILGQTAPGDGITITGANLELSGSCIVRYLRIRPTFKNEIEADGFGGFGASGSIIDHCSVSYSVDECISFYGCDSFTLQNCISSESLKNSGHSKGAHGYGGIWGGSNASFHHNLMASHDSRNPRIAAGIFEGDQEYDMSKQTDITDLRNNIIYNWGGNSAYGGQGAMPVNIINSYYKPGPSTTSHRSRIFETTSTGNGSTSIWATDLYVDGNYMEGSAAVTADNTKGVDHDSAVAKYYVWTKDNITDEAKNIHFKYQNDYPVTTQTAEETYNTLLDHVGASLPKRDETDARVINDVKNGTGRIIDNEAEVGGVMQYETVYRRFEIPQDWKDTNGMGSAAEGDIVQRGRWMGYTWIEAYVNDWTEQQDNPTNPNVTVKASVDGDSIAVTAEATPVGDSPITKIVIYDGDRVISEHETDNVNVTIPATAGKHYVSAVAYNQKGEGTRSAIAVVNV